MGLLVLLVVFGLAIVAAVLLITTQRNQRKAAHRREMQDLVRGRKGGPTTAHNATTDAPQFGGVAQAFTTAAASPQPRQSDLAKELEAISRLGQKGRAKQAQEDAMVRRAERMHAQMVSEVERENRGLRSRPPGPCSLKITYVDADGVYTTRNVAPYKSGNTNEKFDAWCETRQDRRTFYFSRVQSGELVRSRQPLDRAGVFLYVHPGRRVPVELR